MATVGFDSNKNLDNSNDHIKGIRDLLDEGLKNSVPDKYIFPLDRRPTAAQVLQGESIPIIDISGLDGSQNERIQTIQALAQACSEWGFFRAINHGVEVSLMANMLDVAHQFFLLSSEEKMKYGNGDMSDPVRYGTSFNPKVDEFFIWRDYLRHSTHPVLQTPDNPPNYRDVAGQYFMETRKLALKLMAALSESLGLEPNYIERVFREGLQAGIVNLYPECPQPELTMGIAPHSDHGGLTVLLQDVGGLQVRHKGHWVAVEPVPYTFIVNVGDHLEVVSNGRYKSVEHRAVVNAEKTRMSISALNSPALDALISPAPQLVNETHPPLYRSMLYGEFLRHLQTTALRGKDNLDTLKIPKEEE